MSFETLSEVSLLPALVATAAWAALGMVWFAPPVLGRASFRASGWEFPEQAPPLIHLAATAVLYFITAVVTAWIARETGAETVTDGIVLGLAVAIGYALVFVAGTAIWERKARPVAWFLVNAPFTLLGLVIVAVIVTVWD